MPRLHGVRFDGDEVFLRFVGNVQILAPSKEVEGAVWAGAIGSDVT